MANRTVSVQYQVCFKTHINRVEGRIKRQLNSIFCGFTYRDTVSKKLLKTFRHKLPFFLSGILRTQSFLVKFFKKSNGNGFIDLDGSLSNKKI